MYVDFYHILRLRMYTDKFPHGGQLKWKQTLIIKENYQFNDF